MTRNWLPSNNIYSFKKHVTFMLVDLFNLWWHATFLEILLLSWVMADNYSQASGYLVSLTDVTQSAHTTYDAIIIP